MKIAEILSKWALTQQELSDFTGIPRGRIAMWISQDKEPPKAEDVSIIQAAVNYFTNKSKEEIQEAIKLFKVEKDKIVGIIDGNVVAEPVIHYNADNLNQNNEEENGENPVFNIADFNLNLPVNHPLQVMINRIAAAFEKMAESNHKHATSIEKMISIQERLIDRILHDEAKKDPASLSA